MNAIEKAYVDGFESVMKEAQHQAAATPTGNLDAKARLRAMLDRWQVKDRQKVEQDPTQRSTVG